MERLTERTPQIRAGGTDMHSKRNKGGHTFDQNPSGRPRSEDPQGVAQFCKCGLKEYDWNCKWRWS